MKILYLCSDHGIPVLGRKGASVHVRAMVRALHKAGHTVILAAPCLNKSPWEEPTSVEVSLMPMAPGPEIVDTARALKSFNEVLGATNSLPGEIRSVLYNQSLAAQLVHRFAGAPPDFIYERASLYGIAGAVLARELDCPRLVEVNAPLAIEQSTYRGTGLGELASQAEHWSLVRADAVLTVSAALRDFVVSLGVSRDRVRVLPNGVDAELFYPAPPDPAVRARWRLGDGPVIGFVGGLRPWHGIEPLPGLLERLLPRYPSLQLVIVGNGPLRAQLERELQLRRLVPHTVLIDWLPHEDIPQIIRQFDVSLAPYSQSQHLWYFSPLKLFEYMSCGTAVVAADLGQITEVIRDGDTGVLYRHTDNDDLAEACDRVLANPQLRQRLGQAAAKEIQTRYTWDHNASRVIDLARSLVRSAQVAG